MKHIKQIKVLGTQPMNSIIKAVLVIAFQTSTSFGIGKIACHPELLFLMLNLVLHLLGIVRNMNSSIVNEMSYVSSDLFFFCLPLFLPRHLFMLLPGTRSQSCRIRSDDCGSTGPFLPSVHQVSLGGLATFL